MHRLQHERVVKLLGIILEDGNYSLVMEYVQRGNVMKVLQQVSSELLHPLLFLRVDKILERDRMLLLSQRMESFDSHPAFCVRACGSPAFSRDSRGQLCLFCTSQKSRPQLQVQSYRSVENLQKKTAFVNME